MDMARRLPPFWLLATCEGIAFLAAVFAVYCFRIRAFLSGPVIGEWYAHTWSYQLLIFACVWLPVALAVLAIGLWAQRSALQSRYRAQDLAVKGQGQEP
jgi:hypothetical protein